MIEEKIHVETSFSSLIKKNEELCGDKVAIRSWCWPTVWAAESKRTFCPR